MSAALTMFRPRHLAWIPAALLAAWAIAAATGFTMTDTSRAATSSSTVSVTASVLPEVHLDLTNGSCGTLTDPDGAGPLVEDGAFTPAAMSAGGGDTTLATCAITFGSNNNGTNGASLWVESSRTAGTKSFCAAAFNADCLATDSFTETATAGVALADLTDGNFGVKPSAIAGCGGAGADWSTANFYGLPQNTDGTLGSRICDTNSTTDGSTTLTFVADPAAAQAAGNYYVRAIFTAQAT